MLILLAQIAAAIGALVTLWLAVDFARDPEAGMRRAAHRAEVLPRIMVGRYLAFTALALGAAVYGDAVVILFLFAVFSAVSFFDAWTYRRLAHAAAPHTTAGLACWIVIALAGLAVALR
jgi:hypothetical protein